MRFDTESLFRNIRTSKINVNFYRDLDFQGDLLQALDGQTLCDHFGEKVIKIGWMVSDIFKVFSIIPVEQFFHLENID